LASLGFLTGQKPRKAKVRPEKANLNLGFSWLSALAYPGWREILGLRSSPPAQAQIASQQALWRARC
jgi:hypothetical protein